MSNSAVREAADAEVLSVVGDRIRILADGRMTGGRCVLFENISPPGGGPPLHRHTHDDEFFFVLEGTMKFRIDGRDTVVSAGASVAAPRGTVHAFANIGSSPSRMIVMCSPAGLEGPFREVDQLTREGRANLDAIVAAFRRFDLEIMGPPLLPQNPPAA
jgi:quercetin dioxygenase-like cupin family protein